ncbi:unnamed protein product [Arabidopsis thaliana]|uniref:(thale cress) hypothetical protein n=1 Tax=Arabidopsis thaliana TaxID=3702 RepID=A0A7G2F0S1_ARATH|nr:unnamed protein product [Arabidopsis thaliana]
MASKDNLQAHQSRDTSEEKVDKILKTLPELVKLLCPVKEDPLGRREEIQEITQVDNQTEILSRSLSAPPAMTHVAFDGNLIARLQYRFRILKLKLGKLEQFQTNVGGELDTHLSTLHSLITNLDSSNVSSLPTYWIKSDLEGIEKKISDLLYQVPLLSGKQETQKATAYGDQDDEDEDHQGKAYVYLPGIHMNVKDLTKCEVFRQVKQKFMELDIEQRGCLLSFAVFPENRDVHRTMLMYWWIGEGILPVQGAEEAVKKVLKEFTDKKLVEPVEERRKMAPSSYKMCPFVHSSVIHLSHEIGLFDIYRQGKKPTMNHSGMGKVCLVEGSSSQREGNPKRMPLRECIETVFNVSERFPDFALKFFSKQTMLKKKFSLSSTTWKSLRVFYLGRWERSKNRHIRIQNPQLMEYLKHMTKLRVLSFQGISAIRSLNSSVCTLQELIILDLRECYDLQKLPEKISSLRSLIYLDMTGCYMLEWIPFRLALLKNLEVLKGFVVSDEVYEGVACKLNYLKGLKKLRKLSIEINRDDLGVEQIMEDLLDLVSLTSLKVTWRRDLRIIIEFKEPILSLQEMMAKLDGIPYTHKVKNNLPHKLMKLDLQRFPHEELPTWLHPQNLLGLKKLHIGGGRRLKGFGKLPEEATKCAVEVLRLTSLPKLKVGWMELKHIYFPKLAFLENYECPRVTLTPCDRTGIWRSDQD